MSSSVVRQYEEGAYNGLPVLSEKQLSNGDIYTGSYFASRPEGKGKYLWANGCMYEGEWSGGKKSGKGKIAWPSGATYEGEFKGGYMHGNGTYTAVDGSTYKGQFLMDLPHGFGTKCYSNGDVYEGLWNHGVKEGEGRYLWENGNEYFGEWKNGKICGLGVLRRNNGEKYQGQWLDGLEHGEGFYRWADGSCYCGTWNRGVKDGKGKFYPPHADPSKTIVFSLAPSPNWEQRSEVISDGRPNYLKEQRTLSLSDIDTALSSPGIQSSGTSPSKTSERNTRRTYSFEADKYSSTESLDSSGVAESEESDECSYNDLLEDALYTVLDREYVEGILIKEVVKETIPVKVHRKPKPSTLGGFKKPGVMVTKGHPNYDLMISLQLGIRNTVERVSKQPRREIVPADFGPKARLWMKYPPEGFVAVPHQSFEFKWKDYCPMVFRHLREYFHMDSTDYMMSICGTEALRELSSPGKSGSVFYMSLDDQFMIKTMRKAEVKVLLRMLPNYFEHVRTYQNTLITRFYGLHAVKHVGGQKVRFVVMHNMFCSDLRIHKRFDLKGSSQGRTANKGEIEETTTLKDLDLDLVFHLSSPWREHLMDQIEKDCKFLESEKIMDYSLLLGVHISAPKFANVAASRAANSNIFSSGNSESKYEDADEQLKTASITDQDENLGNNHILDCEAYKKRVQVARLKTQLGRNMPARAIRVPPRTEHDLYPERELFREEHDVFLYFGIIDILQEYDMSKRFEHAYKSLQYDASSISAVDPKQYSKRFREFMSRIFPSESL